MDFLLIILCHNFIVNNSSNLKKQTVILSNNMWLKNIKISSLQFLNSYSKFELEK